MLTPLALPAPSNGPALPTGLTASAVSSSRIDLSWMDNANNEAGYVIERKGGADADFVQVGTANADATAYHDSGLTSSTAYTYRVRATNGNGDSPNSNEASATTSAPPSRLASLTLDRHSTLGSNSPVVATVTLTSPATSATTVRLYCNDSDIAVPSSVVVPAGQSVASVSISYNSTPYPLTREATVSAYLGNWAQQDALEVLNTQETISITNFGAEGGDNVAVLTWDPLPDHTYPMRRVERRTIDSSTGQVVATTSFISRGTSYCDFSATNGTIYEYRVAVDSDAGETPPAPTSWARVTPQSSGVSLSWTNPPPSNASGEASVSASLSSYATQGAMLIVDGELAGNTDTGPDSKSYASASLSFDFSSLNAGTHKVRLVTSVNGSEVATPEATVQATGNVFNLQADSLFEWGIGELASVNLRTPPNTYDWQITVLDGSGQTVRSWSGDGGQPASLVWDGSDSTLQSGTRGDYTIKGTVNTPGGPQSITVSTASVDRDPSALFLVSAVTTKAPQKDIDYANFLKDGAERFTVPRTRALRQEDDRQDLQRHSSMDGIKP